MTALPVVRLKPRKSQPFFGRHPWVLDSAIDHVEGEPADGDEVELLSEKGTWIARGLFNSRSRIRVRLYSWDAQRAIDATMLQERLKTAIRLRDDLGLLAPQGACRVVYSEADGLSGLIVDRFGSIVVVQPTALAMAKRLDQIVPTLVEELRPSCVLSRVDEGIATREGLELAPGTLWGDASDGVVFIEEHGLRYGVQPSTGQKTGFYLDQRDNRLAAARHMRGRRVLDLCCYAGGFGLCAIRHGGAKEVIGVDSSEHALRLAKENARLNEIENVHYEKRDCFDDLDARFAAGEKFDAVVLDPPKFARGRGSVDEALRAYHRLNQRAVEILRPGGILVTCSCSGSVSKADFFDMLYGVATRTKRDLQILEDRGAAADHPVNVACPENEYLKCFICRVT